ncbi:hypothetical protein JMJ77_0013622 [Colletotrichum scovillei]|uniref:Uncharacterized protein n=1 Tax=Colletotrichum scovillei TaxID=1209932 RepID=A0A9P7QPJ7_9PEZI|nr:hypothetical protein JMJ78_0012910 [Colletotrichum scovillei]KAG7040625.1 hypothetical protein JMJ77_0013622 [Colletotrichum scovillei]KAG7060672.1 hypothetical protein JMJ76_0006215 [Colletotrichum scovillei]
MWLLYPPEPPIEYCRDCPTPSDITRPSSLVPRRRD